MATIQQLRKKYDTTFAKQHCGIDSTSRCKREFCYCKQNAEIWAYIEDVLPEGYEKLTIFDWDGFSKNCKQVLPTATATKEPQATSHKGTLDGKQKARRSPVSAALPSKIVTSLLRNF